MRIKLLIDKDLQQLEEKVNAFLATVPSSGIKHVSFATNVTRSEPDQHAVQHIAAVWYEERDLAGIR